MVEAQAKEDGLEGCLLCSRAGPATNLVCYLSATADPAQKLGTHPSAGKAFTTLGMWAATAMLCTRSQRCSCTLLAAYDGLQKLVQVRVEEWAPAAHLLVECSKGAPHVGAHITWGLIRDLDTGLQDGLWHNLGLQVEPRTSGNAESLAMLYRMLTCSIQADHA